MNPQKTTVGWFSGGVSSAVAIKLLLDEIDEVIYIHIDDQHPDTLRFLQDCSNWYNRPIEVKRHPLWHSVEQVVRAKRFTHAPRRGAVCTRLLKREVRQRWEHDHPQPLRYVWGLDAQEGHRVESLVRANPGQEHVFPLVDRGIGKREAHEILCASGILRPKMYELGYHKNNCIGCVRGGMGYFNKVRRDFPEVFAARAALEREVGCTCINGIYLDELDPSAGRHDRPITDECGLLCEFLRLE